MNPIVESVRPLHSFKIWEDISPQFLVTFWSLSMYDLQVPADTYKKEIDKLNMLSSSKDVVSWFCIHMFILWLVCSIDCRYNTADLTKEIELLAPVISKSL